jgi:hypothetical protein
VRTRRVRLTNTVTNSNAYSHHSGEPHSDSDRNAKSYTDCDSESNTYSNPNSYAGVWFSGDD